MENLTHSPFPTGGNLEGKLLYGEAGKTIDAMGKKVKARSDAWLLELVQGDSRFNLEVLVPKSSSSQPINSPAFLLAENISAETDTTGYVPIKFKTPDLKEYSVFVKLKDLEDRFHLDEETIAAYLKEGKLEEFISQEMSYLPKAIDYFEKTKNAYFKVHRHEDQEILAAKIKTEGSSIYEPTSLTPTDLMNISKAAAQGFEYYLQDLPHLEVGMRFKEGKIKLYSLTERYDEEYQIGQGSYNRVFQIAVLHSGQAAALKMARRKPGAAEENANLKLILDTLALRGTHPAIPKPPKQVFKMTNIETDKTQLGFLLSLNQGDVRFEEGESYYPSSLEHPLLLHYMQQMVNGLCFMKEGGVIHGDIQPQNIAITKDGTLAFDDMGGSTIVHADPTENQIAPPLLSLGTIGTDFALYSEVQNAQEAINLSNLLIKLETTYFYGIDFKGNEKSLKDAGQFLVHEIERIDQEIDLITNSLSPDISREKILRERKEIFQKIQVEIDSIVSNDNQLEAPSTISPERKQLLENYRRVSIQNYIEKRERMEIFALGIVFSHMLLEGKSPLHYPEGIPENEGSLKYQTPFYRAEAYNPSAKRPFFSPEVNKDKYTFEPFRQEMMDKGWPPSVADAIESMVDPNPLKRPSFEECDQIWKRIEIT